MSEGAAPAPYIHKAGDKGIQKAISGLPGVSKSATAARHLAEAYGEGDVRKGYEVMIAFGVALVELLWSAAFWQVRYADRLIWPERAFSFSERQIWTTVKRALGGLDLNDARWEQLRRLLVKFRIVDEHGRDGSIRQRLPWVDAAIILLVCMYSALVRDRDERAAGSATSIDWTLLFVPFCYWGHVILEAVEQGAIHFDSEGELHVDQGALLELRTEKHISLHKFMVDAQATVDSSRARATPIPRPAAPSATSDGQHFRVADAAIQQALDARLEHRKFSK